MTSPSESPDPARGASQQRRLSLLLALNLALIAALVVVGVAAHSIGVLAAAGDFVADSLAIVLGLVAVRLRDMRGRAMAPTYVALVNGALLLAVTIGVIAESIRRLLAGVPEVEGLPVLVVSAVSALAMGAGALILGARASSEDLHMRSVLLDTLSDALSSAAVAAVGAVILFARGLYWLDPVVAIILGLILGVGAIRLLHDVVLSLQGRKGFEVPDG